MKRDLLVANDIHLAFGGVRALNGADLRIGAGERVGLIGPNGAGKTSLFNVISGLYRAQRGSVLLDGRPISALGPHEIAREGVYRTFQNLAVIESCTVVENVMLGAAVEVGLPFIGSVLRPMRTRARERALRERALDALDTCGIAANADDLPASLPYGTLKRVELARALMADARLLMLDELAAGLMPSEVDTLGDLLLSLQQQHGFALLIVEHHMDFVMGLSERVTVLDAGRTLAQGTPAEIRADELVLAAYLGGEP